MTIDPWDFTSIVTAPYLVAFLLMIRRSLRRDGGGKNHGSDDPAATIAFALAGVSIAVPALFITLRMFHVFIPYGSVWVGCLGLVWLCVAIWQQRRPAPAAPTSRQLGPLA